jgi:hypothetical protein
MRHDLLPIDATRDMHGRTCGAAPTASNRFGLRPGVCDDLLRFLQAVTCKPNRKSQFARSHAPARRGVLGLSDGRIDTC